MFLVYKPQSLAFFCANFELYDALRRERGAVPKNFCIFVISSWSAIERYMSCHSKAAAINLTLAYLTIITQYHSKVANSGNKFIKSNSEINKIAL